MVTIQFNACENHLEHQESRCECWCAWLNRQMFCCCIGTESALCNVELLSDLFHSYWLACWFWVKQIRKDPLGIMLFILLWPFLDLTIVLYCTHGKIKYRSICTLCKEQCSSSGETGVSCHIMTRASNYKDCTQMPNFTKSCCDFHLQAKIVLLSYFL